jgi:predicted esterase
MMNKHKIAVKKTARYFILGNVSEQVKQIWFVCHGYAQLASYFLKKFESLQNPEILIVAPEGLNRFYIEGVSGRVAASWMTKEDREDEIRDYVAYLDAVYEELSSQLRSKNIIVNVLGFSQGTATVCRWLALGNIKADNLILWAGPFPDDLDLEENKKLFDKSKIYFVLGDNDPYISEEKVQEHVGMLKGKLNFEVLRFEGGHEINQEALKKIADELTSAI